MFLQKKKWSIIEYVKFGGIKMNLTREQARQLSVENNKEKHKKILKKDGEGALYARLNAKHLSEVPEGMTKVAYVEKLKKEIEQENKKNFNGSN